MAHYFNADQFPQAIRAFIAAERLVFDSFGIGGNVLQKNKYDIKTLAYLAQHEIKDGTFAHLCKYSYETRGDTMENSQSVFDFYRICLQDNIILDAVERANSFIKFSSLMLYIAVHELIHVFRFDTGAIDFNASDEQKAAEEKIVHNLTKIALQRALHHDLAVVLDCFSSEFKICDI